jgi:hypothetical protein
MKLNFQNKIDRMTMTRRGFVGVAGGAGAMWGQGTPGQSTLRWTDAKSLTVEGQGFSDLKAPWDRLPARAESVVRKAVWDLSRQPAGVAVRFVSEATTIWARWKLSNQRFASPTMAAVASSGLDLYARTPDGTWRWVAASAPTEFPVNEKKVIGDIRPGRREYMLYLPLHNPMESLEIGMAEGAKIEAAPARAKKPLVFYGTSITHGAAASRPGMIHTSILGRRFDWPVINLGFGGNGKLELEVARFLVELDPVAYVIDCLPNLVAAEVAERTVPFVEFMRKARPSTPMLLVEDRTYQDSYWIEAKRKRNDESRAEFRKAYAQLLAKGVKGLAYLGGEGLLGGDGEGTVDSSHPTDLGFVRQANAFEPYLSQWLR